MKYCIYVNENITVDKSTLQSIKQEIEKINTLPYYSSEFNIQQFMLDPKTCIAKISKASIPPNNNYNLKSICYL